MHVKQTRGQPLLAKRFLIGVFLVQATFGGEYLVVTRSASGVWEFQSVESISVNRKEKLRSAPFAASSPSSWDSKAISLGRVQ